MSALMQRRHWLGLAAAAGLSAWSRVAQAAGLAGLTPVEHFARLPLMRSVAVSPSGQQVAAVVNDGDTARLVCRAVGGQGTKVVLSSPTLERQINWVRWASETRLLVSFRFPGKRADQSQYIETMERRLFAVNTDGSGLLNVVKSVGRLAEQLQFFPSQDRVVDFLPDDPDHILLMLPDEAGGELAVFKVNVHTAERRHYASARAGVHTWITDGQHRVRIGVGHDDITRESFTVVCDAEGGRWREMSRAPAFESPPFVPMGFGKDPNRLYLSGIHDDARAVFVQDLSVPGRPPELFFSDPERSLNGDLIYGAHGEPVGVDAVENGKEFARYWDTAYLQLLEGLHAAVPGRQLRIASSSRSGLVHAVMAESPEEPPTWLVLGSDDNGPMEVLSRTYPELKGRALSRKKPLSFTARDGLPLQGFLSVPPGHAGGKLPLVVFPHGGPQASDGPEFDEWVCFMTDRGCAVLQVNFRGSTGFGRHHLHAGLGRWGLEMQDDLTDGVQELVKQGVADPARVAIVGASYGGYAALMGLVKTPELYRAAFAFAPVTDLVMLTKDALRRGQKVVLKQVGDPAKDFGRLESTSPARQAARIQRPCVILHGTQDRQVEYEHATVMVQALQAAGKPHEFIEFKSGDHQLSHYPHRLVLFQTLDRFLQQHLLA